MTMIGWCVVADVMTVAACMVRGGSFRSTDTRSPPLLNSADGSTEGLSVRL